MSEVQPSVTPRRKQGRRINLWWCLLKGKHSTPIQVDQVLGSSISHHASTFFKQTGKNTDLLHWCKPFSKLLCCASLNKSTAAHLMLHVSWFILLMQWQLHRERPHATAQSFQGKYISRVIPAPLTPKSAPYAVITEEVYKTKLLQSLHIKQHYPPSLKLTFKNKPFLQLLSAEHTVALSGLSKKCYNTTHCFCWSGV